MGGGLRAPGLRRPSSAALGVLVLLAVTASWGSTFVLIKGAVARMPVVDFLAFRFVIAAVALAAVRPAAVRALPARRWAQGFGLGLVYGTAQILQTMGIQHTPAAVSGFVTGMYVVFTPLLGAVVLRRRVAPNAWLAVAVSTGGLALLALHGFAIGYGESLVLASAVLYAVHIQGLGAWSRPGDAYALTVVQMATIAVETTIAALPGGLSAPPGPGPWGVVVYTALVAGALAVLGQTWAQSHLSPTRAAVIMTMEPVFAAVFAVAIGGEALTGRMLGGGALVVAAMYLVELRRGGFGRGAGEIPLAGPEPVVPAGPVSAGPVSAEPVSAGDRRGRPGGGADRGVPQP